mgnify:CR=1 FL=1
MIDRAGKKFSALIFMIFRRNGFILVPLLNISLDKIKSILLNLMYFICMVCVVFNTIIHILYI